MLVSRRVVIGVVPAGFLGGFFAMPKVGKPAPPFSLTTLVEGRRVSLADLAGKVLVLNFWATWCAPCRVEMPMLEGYARAHRDSDLRLFGVSVDDVNSVSQMRMLASVTAYPLAYRFSGPYGPIGGEVPSNYVIDRAGLVRYAKAGAFADDGALDAVVAPLLAQPPPGKRATA
jgi:cytochrome c biogenesis protein CcmG, thiol:disulfide interchange protein DsbE